MTIIIRINKILQPWFTFCTKVPLQKSWYKSFLLWRWWQSLPPKRRCPPTAVHGVMALFSSGMTALTSWNALTVWPVLDASRESVLMRLLAICSWKLSFALKCAARRIGRKRIAREATWRRFVFWTVRRERGILWLIWEAENCHLK